MSKRQKNKIVLPKEHGSWAMFILPVLIGILFTEFKWIHLPFTIGWFFIFLLSTPLLNIFRSKRRKNQMMPWIYIYGSLAIIFLIPVLIAVPEIVLFGLAMIPFLIISILFIKARNERSLINDLSGILIFMIGGAASYYIGKESVTTEMFILILITALYFLASAFYIKSLIRKLKEPKYKWMSHIYHGVLLTVPFIIQWPALIFAYLPATIKDWVTPRKRYRPMYLGITEITNSVIFLVVLLIIN